MLSRWQKKVNRVKIWLRIPCIAFDGNILLCGLRWRERRLWFGVPAGHRFGRQLAPSPGQRQLLDQSGVSDGRVVLQHAAGQLQGNERLSSAPRHETDFTAFSKRHPENFIVAHLRYFHCNWYRDKMAAIIV